MDGGQRVWAPHPVEGYQLGVIVDVGVDTLTVEPLDSPKQVVVASYDNVFPAVDEGTRDVDDNCSLMYLNEATLLHNLRLRYERSQIYTYVANILLAVNPYQVLPSLYSSEMVRKYTSKSLGVLPPHIFAIADKAYRDMRSTKGSQSIIVSGESGAGKTESTKYILRYLTESYGSSAGVIEQRIVEANPLLESFGNAKTMRNNNSSRFGKFVEVHFGSKYEVVGGMVSHYLLEKSRICSQSSEERNYHVFYRMLAGAPPDMKNSLGLNESGSFQYLNPASISDPSMDDVEEYKHLEQSMDKIGLTAQEKSDLFRVVAAVLHLGNISFAENTRDKKGGSVVTPGSQVPLAGTASLLGLEPSELQRSLTSRVMTTTKKGTVGTIINVPLKTDQAANARDALAKALYVRLFDHVVARVNSCFPFKQSSYYIGVLDIAGFEYLQSNSFEQFCINYCNEKLQQFFNARVLKEEQDLYQRESLGVKEVQYVDNQDCIDLVEARVTGIIDLLDEECKLPKCSNQHFTEMLHQTHQKHFRLTVPRKSKLTYYRNLRDDEGFIIRHFAGAVCYQTVGFLEKNNDALHASLEQLVTISKDPFIKKLFPEAADMGAPSPSPSPSTVSPVNTKRLALVSVGRNFRTQLNDLMKKLQSTGSCFIRCLKPNQKMESHQFFGGQILSQLQCAGMVTVLELMQGGYPSRAQFSDLYSMYQAFLPAKLARLDPRTFCQTLFRAVGMSPNDFRFGMSKVFFRPGKFAEFDQIMKSDPDNLASLVAKVQKWLVRKRWRKVIYGTICVQKLVRKIRYRAENAVRVQKFVRMCLVLRKHRPRYRGIANLNKLQCRVPVLSHVVSSLKRDKEKLVARVGELEQSIQQQINAIKTSVLSQKGIEEAHERLVLTTEEFLKELKSRQEQQRIEEEEMEKLKKIREEQDRERKRREAEAAKLRKLQEEMERERRKREEEERRRKQEAEERRLLAEMEERRKREEEAERKRLEEEERQRMKQIEADRLIAEKLEGEEREREAQRLAMLEQERRDYELAVRLAEAEMQPRASVLPDASAQAAPKSQIAAHSLQRSADYNTRQQEDARKKYQLNKWKFAELRDTINTSCDIDLLEACRVEFHRRLRVYHAWKMRNKRRTPGGGDERRADDQRAPDEVMNVANQAKPPPPTPPMRKSSLPPPEDQPRVQTSTQRYFRVPFVRHDRFDRQKGWWFAHFDGQWVVRQLELHEGKEPLLLVAGRDDMEMCELSLEETGLTRKRGAEILEHVFEETWKMHGGKPYTGGARRK